MFKPSSQLILTCLCGHSCSYARSVPSRTPTILPILLKSAPGIFQTREPESMGTNFNQAIILMKIYANIEFGTLQQMFE